MTFKLIVKPLKFFFFFLKVKLDTTCTQLSNQTKKYKIFQNLKIIFSIRKKKKWKSTRILKNKCRWGFANTKKKKKEAHFHQIWSICFPPPFFSLSFLKINYFSPFFFPSKNAIIIVVTERTFHLPKFSSSTNKGYFLPLSLVLNKTMTLRSEQCINK